MKPINYLLPVGVMFLTITGCASVMHGASQRIGVSSAPDGAKVVINNIPMGTTPLFADLNRNSEHIVSIEMDGYEKAQFTVSKQFSGWVLGNIVFGGLIGLAIDSITGGLYKLSPDQLNTELQKIGSTVTANRNGIVVVAVLQPNPSWEKMGRLQPMN